MTRLVIFLLVCVEIYFCSALYEEAACKRLGGSCKYTSQCARARQRSGKCPRQPSNVKCCVPYQESACTRARGSCKYTHACSGTSKPGLCPTQPAGVKCCLGRGKSVPSRKSGKKCIDCICKVESNCRRLGCRGDVNSLSRGYFQIKKPYYTDCGSPRGKTDAGWKSCAKNYNCAKRCVEAYVRRYGSKCPGKNSCERMARIHNGGPNGCRNRNTLGYWKKVQRC